MKIKNIKNKIICTNCGSLWKPDIKFDTLCTNCFCPEKYCTLVDDIAWYQSGIILEKLSANALKEFKIIVEEQISMAIPPMTFEELCINQPEAKILLEKVIND